MKPLHFSKKELEECSNKTFQKLKIRLPNCKEDVHLHIGTDDWGVHFISYGNRDEMTELLNMILKWKHDSEHLKELTKIYGWGK